MKHTIYTKLLISYLIYGVIAFFIICTFTQHLTTDYIEKQEASNLYREASIIAGDYAAEYFDSSMSLSDFQNHMKIVADYMDAKVWVVSPDGELLMDSDDPSIGIDIQNDSSKPVVINGFDVTDFGSNNYMIGDFYGSFKHKMLSVFSPVNVSYQNIGYIVIHKTMSHITAGVNGFMNISFYTVALIFAFAFVLLFMMSRSIYRPISKITKTAKKYAKGDFTAQIDVHSNDEIGYLANTLNYMATELDTLEEDQRKFVSNVSHDFRSPLTSIKGYVEAMLDGTIPVEMQDKYLNIILFETERLNKLTKSLIDLNQFGHHGIHLDIADFDINTMIRTTILTFEGKCSEKGLSFDLLLTGKELFVRGDMVKIQQILYNLIDNAVKFSNNDSSIKIETSIRNEKVFISVKDHGIGIPKDSLSKIWERFYKSDLSRGKDKRGTGLGLSIVKEIVQAHGENINVISTEGVGTEFIFTLPLSKKEGRAQHTVYSSEKCEVSRGCLSGQIMVLFTFSFFFTLWNSAAVHIFLRNTLYALRLIQVYGRGALLPCILAVPDLFHWREILSGTFCFLNLKLISLMRNELY